VDAKLVHFVAITKGDISKLETAKKKKQKGSAKKKR